MAFAKIGNVAYDRRVTYNNPACRGVLVWWYLENALLLVNCELVVANEAICGTCVIDPFAINFISV